MDIVKLDPATKDYIWGGTKLLSWGKKAPTSSIAECWELSCNKEGPSIIASGKNAGKPLMDCATKEDFGSKVASFEFFPVLIKLIDAADNLSVQVHPSDEYALKNEGQYGKTEMWYVISADKGAGLYIGFKRKTSAEEVRKAVNDGTIMSLLNFQEVAPGQVYFIRSGTVHAIGKGVTVMEIQQNSTLTYRLYDYKRLGKDGKPRELHLEKALKVLNYEPYVAPVFKNGVLGECAYFTVSKGDAKLNNLVQSPLDSFASFTFVDDGKGTVSGIPYKKGDTFFVPAGKVATIQGTGSYILTEVR
jgi:mannose-6-phosphate isomerase